MGDDFSVHSVAVGFLAIASNGDTQRNRTKGKNLILAKKSRRRPIENISLFFDCAPA